MHMIQKQHSADVWNGFSDEEISATNLLHINVQFIVVRSIVRYKNVHSSLVYAIYLGSGAECSREGFFSAVFLHRLLHYMCNVLVNTRTKMLCSHSFHWFCLLLLVTTAMVASAAAKIPPPTAVYIATLAT